MNIEDVEPILRDACKFARGLLKRLAAVHRTAMAIEVNRLYLPISEGWSSGWWLRSWNS